jgi:beta-lactamase class C
MSWKRKYTVFFSLILIFVSISDIKQASETALTTPAPEISPIIKALSLEYDQYIEEKMQRGYIPGAAVCIIKDDKIVHLKGYGIKDINSHDSIGIHTVFRLGSVSKSIAATLTGILVEDSLLNWDNHIKSYLPEFRLKSESSTNSLKIKHILSHTTGLIRHSYTNYIEQCKPLEEMIPALSNVNLIGAPGTVYSYQNLAFGLIEPIVEQVTGLEYEDALVERLFKPMNMRNSSASYEAIIQNRDVAYPHYYYRGKLKKSRISRKYYNAAPAGGINASIWDMANYMISITGHKPWVISQATLNELYSPKIPTYIKYNYFGSWPKMRYSYYGLGFRILEYENKKVVYHGGYVNGYRTGMAFLPDDNIGICILTNYSGNLANKGIRDFIDMYINYEEYIKDYDNITKVNQVASHTIPERMHISIPPQ